MFLRLLGLVHIFAFGSLGAQILGLAGSQGILPAAEYLARVQAHLSDQAVWRVPTVFWISASDAALVGVCALGVAIGGWLAVGLFERYALASLFVLYLSVCGVGGPFLAFQWDALLLEVSAVGLLVTRRGMVSRPRPPDPWALFALRLVLVKLLVSSGWVKLASGDPTWAEGTALVYHYETQPLPTMLAWWAHHLPAIWHRFEVWAVLAIQLCVAPFALSPWRAWAFGPLAGLQLLIAATGNYAFFNLITFALCLTLLSDATYRAIAMRLSASARGQPARASARGQPARASARGQPARAATSSGAALSPGAVGRVTAWGRRILAGGVAVLVAGPFVGTVAPSALPPSLEYVNSALRPLRTFNAYGLFAVMTTERYEIEVQGSHDGETWTPYPFVAKPGPVDRAPILAAPNQPRLDWQMWFAALGSRRQNPWFEGLMVRLLQGSPEVLRLFASDPFEGRPPRYVRAMRYRYRFSSPGTRAGTWWTREPAGDYFPVVSLSE